MNIDIKVFQQVDSTNAVLKELAQNGAKDGTVVVAWSQSAGRGRLGRNFASPKGGLYMSILLPFDETMTITAKAAVAVKKAVAGVTDKRVSIKWVNDIILDGKKLCGILAEAVKDHIVLGIGLNFSTRIKDLPEDVQKIATSIYRGPENEESDSMDLVNAIVKEIVELAETKDTLWLGEYRSASTLIGKNVNIIQADKVVGSGTVTEIDNNCALHIMDNGVETVLSTGEVTIREK